jgi:hypothetical protein
MDTLMQLLESELHTLRESELQTTVGAAATPVCGPSQTGRVWARENAQLAGLLDHALEHLETSTSPTRAAHEKSEAHAPRLIGTQVAASFVACAESLSPSPAQRAETTENDAVQRGKPWSNEKREKHRIACKSKSKLSLGEKLDIIRHYADGYTQAQLAEKYGKSRAAISKILRPENVARLNKVSETGIEPHMRSYSHIIQNLELEKRVHEISLAASVGGDSRASIKAHIIKTFGVSRGWYTRFCKRHSV